MSTLISDAFRLHRHTLRLAGAGSQPLVLHAEQVGKSNKP